MGAADVLHLFGFLLVGLIVSQAEDRFRNGKPPLQTPWSSRVPCLICACLAYGRQPSDPNHLEFAQPARLPARSAARSQCCSAACTIGRSTKIHEPSDPAGRLMHEGGPSGLDRHTATSPNSIYRGRMR